MVSRQQARKRTKQVQGLFCHVALNKGIAVTIGKEPRMLEKLP
jgi:hypothetical protein